MLAVDQGDRLQPVLPILIPESRQYQMVVSLQNAPAEGKAKTMLETVGLVLRRIELEPHCM